MSLEEKFLKFINNNKLLNGNSKVLLGVSGGVDSMVMLHLFHLCRISFGVAHINYRLRGSESDGDELLVQRVCKQYEIVLHHTEFDTQSVAKESKVSIQMAARELRYKYFEQLLAENSYDYIATAHHADDNLETFFINLIRGSGIKGLGGIPVKNGHIIRPLLFARREEIEAYAHQHHIEYRTDSSNHEDYYLRNRIRHHLTPIWDKLHNHAAQQILKSMQYAAMDSELLNELGSQVLQDLVSKHPQGQALNITKLLAYKNASALLFFWLKDKGFTAEQISQIMQATLTSSGQIFYGNDHILLHNRNELILQSNVAFNTEEEIQISEDVFRIDNPLSLSFTISTESECNYKSADSNTAFIDADKVKWPLTLRLWKKGDIMQPLGMKNNKKISDILIDSKIDKFSKNKTYVLCNHTGEVIWLIGLRVSEIFKINKCTTRILRVEHCINNA